MCIFDTCVVLAEQLEMLCKQYRALRFFLANGEQGQLKIGVLLDFGMNLCC